MSTRRRIRRFTAVWVVATTAGCTQAPWDEAPDLRQMAEGGPSLPRHPLQQPMDAGLADSDAGTSEDASPGDSQVDATTEATTRRFPHVDYDAFPPAPEAPLCAAGGMLDVVRSVTLFKLGPSGTILGSVSPDGLSAAWTIPGSNSPGDSAPTAVFVADRASTSDAFGAPQAVDFGQLLVAPDKVSLSPDRLRLVAVRADQQAFVELSRSGPTHPFGSPSEDSFVAINTAAQATKDPIGDPTIAGDDRAFFYTRALAVIESDRGSTEPWPEGTETSLDYSLNPGQRPRLSAISEDHLTLFFWDDQRLFENAAWRILPDEPFRTVVQLPLVPWAQPTASCTSLFFGSAAPNGDIRLALASATIGL